MGASTCCQLECARGLTIHSSRARIRAAPKCMPSATFALSRRADAGRLNSGVSSTHTFSSTQPRKHGLMTNLPPSSSEKRTSFVDVFNTIGSLASITGVSVLWLKGTGTINWEVILLAALAVPALVGLASALAWALLLGYRTPTISGSHLLRIAYLGLGYPIATLAGLLLILLANKLFISLDWRWFFHSQY